VTQGHIEVLVDIDGVPLLAGSLWVHEGGTEGATFRYADGYLDDPRAYDRAPALPRSAGEFHTPAGHKMFSVFADSAPDRWGRTLMGRAEKARAGALGQTPRPPHCASSTTVTTLTVQGPVGVGKTFLATALGHIACRRRYRVHFERADKMFKRLKAVRLDNGAEAEMRKLVGVDLLLIDGFALHPLDVTETNDFYELVVERHRQGGDGHHVEPGPERVPGTDGRPAPRPVGRGPHPERGLRARLRGRVLPQTPEASGAIVTVARAVSGMAKAHRLR